MTRVHSSEDALIPIEQVDMPSLSVWLVPGENDGLHIRQWSSDGLEPGTHHLVPKCLADRESASWMQRALNAENAIRAYGKLADTFNVFGTPVTMFRCCGCQTVFTVCPAVPDDKLDEWAGCMGDECSTYDEARDGDKLFDAGKVQRTGDRSCFTLVPKDTK